VNGGDEGLSVEGRGLDEDVVFSVFESREPGGVLWVGDGFAVGRTIRTTIDQGHGKGLVCGMGNVGCHFFPWRRLRGVPLEPCIDRVVEKPCDGLHSCLSGFGGDHALGTSHFPCNVVVVMGAV
jgi:hypothetical protein